LTFSQSEVIHLVWSNPAIVARWKELLESDASVNWSTLSLEAFRDRLREFDETIGNIDKELGLRRLRRERLAAEAREAEFAAR
jgi:hypothetical protein